MDMFGAMIRATQQLFAPGPLLGMLLVLPIALIAGIKPGGHLPVLAVLLSFAGYVDPWIIGPTAVFYIAAVDIGEPVPSILLGIPGARSAQATVLDGYPMAKQGLAGVALGASYTCTLVGGVFGAIILLICLPFSFKLLLHFSSAEFFLLTLIGIMVIAVVSSGALAKGILAGALGIAIAMVGVPAVGGDARGDFGIDYLWDGISLVPITVGLFALPEMIALVTGGQAIAGKRLDVLLKEAQGDVYQGMQAALKHKMLLLRSSIIGVIVGIIPGAGGQAGHWMAYAVARQTERGARQSFGTGDIRGVIAADSANNSSNGGQLIPTVVLGIPGSGSMALFIGMMILSGVVPGPQMLKVNLDLIIALVFACILGNTVSVPIMLAFAPFFARITLLRPDILGPVVIALTSIGAFMANTSMGDLALTAALGVLGLFMKRYGLPRPPILIAVALGKILEKYMVISLAAFGFKMLVRPPFLVVCASMALVMIWGRRVQKRASKEQSESSDVSQSEPAEGTSSSEDLRPGGLPPEKDAATTSTPHRYSLEFFGEVVLLGVTGIFFGYMFIDTLTMPVLARLLPWLAVGLGVPFWLYRTVNLFKQKGAASSELIMDTGFLTGVDPKSELQGFCRISLFTVALYLGIWLFGFHLALPLLVFFYLLKYGRAGWIWSVFTALIFAVLIIGVFDWTLHVPWHEPLLGRFLP
jgi:TctA family transporter